MEKSVHVYILKLSNGNYYTGISNNIKKRVDQHNKGMSKYKSRFTPVSLVHSEEHASRKKARRKEVYIKQRGAKRYLLSLKYNTISPL